MIFTYLKQTGTNIFNGYTYSVAEMVATFANNILNLLLELLTIRPSVESTVKQFQSTKYTDYNVM